MVITTIIHNHIIKRILVDQGSSTYILYDYMTKVMHISMNKLTPYQGNLIGLSRK